MEVEHPEARVENMGLHGDWELDGITRKGVSVSGAMICRKHLHLSGSDVCGTGEEPEGPWGSDPEPEEGRGGEGDTAGALGDVGRVRKRSVRAGLNQGSPL